MAKRSAGTVIIRKNRSINTAALLAHPQAAWTSPLTSPEPRLDLKWEGIWKPICCTGPGQQHANTWQANFGASTNLPMKLLSF